MTIIDQQDNDKQQNWGGLGGQQMHYMKKIYITVVNTQFHTALGRSL